MASLRLIKYVVRKEIREIARDGRLRLLGFLVLVLAFAALAFGVQQTLRAQHEREHARESAAAQWEGQGDKNPHVAAHYGTHLFAPTSVATAIDPGVSEFLGRSVKIEAHRRNLASHSAAQDSAGLKRLGAFSVASVLLQLVPLLLIALGYGLWSRERERGTLRQVLSTGVDRSTLFWGKAIALSVVVGVMLLPAALVILSVLWWLGGGDTSALMRLVLLGLCYGVYFTVFGALTLAASAMARTSRGALVAMIGIWGAFCLVAPRVATEFAGVISPLPSRVQLARTVSEALEKGVDGKSEREVAIEAISKDLMAAQGMSDMGMMVDENITNGIGLQAEAQWENTVFEYVIRQLDDDIAAQETAVSWVGLISPYIAMRTLSSGLSGTDFAHHRHFTEYAESWRKSFIDQLNTAFAKNAGDKGWDYRAGPELWKQAPPMEYQVPSPGFALRTHTFSLGILLVWLFVALGLALGAAHRVRAV